MTSTFSFTQVVSEKMHHVPHGDTLIDLVLLSEPSQLTRCTTIPPLGNSQLSYHNGLSVLLKWRVSGGPPVTNCKPRSVWRYKFADFEKACSLIDAANWDQLLPMDVNLAWDMWQRQFLCIMEQCIPKATFRKKRNLPWLNKSIVPAIRKKNRLFRERKRTNDTTISGKYVKARNHVTTMLRKAKRDYFMKLQGASKKDFGKPSNVSTKIQQQFLI